MELIFIGTGSGKTSLKRHHTSILIVTENHSLLIDSGDGTSAALLKQQIPINQIDSILFTHHHADHFAGLPSIITQMKLNKRETDLMIFTHEALKVSLEAFLNECHLFKETTRFNINIIGYKDSEEHMISGKLSFMPRRNSHIVKKPNLENYNDTRFVSCSLMITADNKKIHYTSDIGSETDLYLFKEEQINYMITETTHIFTEQIYRAFKDLSPDMLYLTHIGDEIETSLHNWHKNLPDSEKIFITQDGLTIKL